MLVAEYRRWYGSSDGDERRRTGGGTIQRVGQPRTDRIVLQIQNHSVTREVERSLELLTSESLAREIHEEILADATRSRSWLKEWLRNLGMHIRAEHRAYRGCAISIGNESSCCQMVRNNEDGLRLDISGIDMEFGRGEKLPQGSGRSPPLKNNDRSPQIWQRKPFKKWLIWPDSDAHPRHSAR